MAPLLPKLRGHFAEFLNNTSPVGLWIFSSSTCVGFGTGMYDAIAAFLGSVDSATSLLFFSPHRISSYDGGFAYRLKLYA